METTPSDLERFFGYVRAFELAYLTDNWSLLEPCFSEDACHLVDDGGVLGGDDHGRAALIEGLRESVHRNDRRFDVRIPEILSGPEVRADGIWMRWALTLRRAGLPELRFEGDHLAVYGGGRIRRLEERVEPGAAERVAAYLAEHGPRLRPEGSPCALPSGADLRDLEAATGRSLVRCYAAAKSCQDAGAALAVCSDDFVLETPAFGTRATSRAEAAAQLAVFFRAFPDYGVELEGMAEGPGVVATWGRARLSLRGEMLGFAPTGKTADLPMFCVMGCAGGALRSERFFFDRAELCEQLGLPVAALSEALSKLRALEG
jgi:predicted ester cyclase